MAQASVKDLPASLKELAKKEVGENPQHVSAHLTSFKRWLSASPHLKVPGNDLFFLSFLRYAHYDHSLAQRRIDNFCTLRCSDPITSTWYEYPPLASPLVETYLKSGIFIPVGFTSQHRYTIIIRLGAWNPKELDQRLMRTMNNMNFERLILEHGCQIGGLCLIIDMSNTSMELFKLWADLKFAKSSFKLMQEASPGRVKNLIFFKESKTFDAAFKLCEIWLSEKMRNRIMRVREEMKKAFKKVPGLKDVLPVEYGGSNGSLEQVLAKSNQEFRDHYSQSYPLQDIRVDETKRPASARNFIKEYKEVDASSFGLAGTYIKLDPID